MARVIGQRTVASLALHPSGELLKAAAAINQPLRWLLPDGTIAAPKGVFRFKTMADANWQQEQWLAAAMAQARRTRRA